MLNYANIKISENDEESLIGNILIDEDGWTEGIVREKNNSDAQKRFIFGIFHRTKAIQLYCINASTPIEIQKFYAIKHFYLDTSYKGQTSLLTYSVEDVIGKCDISSSSLEKDPRDMDTEKDEFIEMIEKWKNCALKGEGKAIYSKYLEDKDKLSKKVLDKYESSQQTK